MKKLLNNPKVKIFIVGGYVRDRLLGLEAHDHDFVVVGATPEDMIDAGFNQVGADFPVFLSPQTGDEFALARTERKTGPGYHGFETFFDPSVTLEEDLKRRDLTINSMAREVLGFNMIGHAKLSDEIIDPFNGRKDLEEGIIRHTSEAFGEDPVRVLRAIRFAARYDFKISIETFDLMKWMVRDGELDHLTPERVWQEFEKAASKPRMVDFVKMLETVGALNIIAPELVQPRCLQNRMEITLELEMILHSNPLLPFVVLTLFDTPEEAKTIWTRLKAPNDVVNACVRSCQMMEMLDDDVWEESGEFLFNGLEKLDAFRNPENVKFLSKLTPCIPNFEWSSRISVFEAASRAANRVNFNQLPENERNSLKGVEIGEAIKRERINTLEDLIIKITQEKNNVKQSKIKRNGRSTYK